MAARTITPICRRHRRDIIYSLFPESRDQKRPLLVRADDERMLTGNPFRRVGWALS